MQFQINAISVRNQVLDEMSPHPSLTFENTTGVVTVTWQKKADDWKVAGYRFNVGDVDFLMDDDTEESPEQD